jgi:hypothetical protein
MKCTQEKTKILGRRPEIDFYPAVSLGIQSTLRSLINFAGFPPTIENGSTLLVTTLLAATIEPSPTTTPIAIKAPAKTQLPRSTRIGL